MMLKKSTQHAVSERRLRAAALPATIVSLYSRNERSGTPASKAVPVRIFPSSTQ